MKTHSPAKKLPTPKLPASLFIRNILLSLLFILLPDTAFANTTYTITDDATGGDCELIGNWTGSLKTCVLTQDVSGGIFLATQDLTLDGNGHTLTGDGTGNGITLQQQFGMNPSGSTVTDITVENFENGVYFWFAQDVELKNSHIENNKKGVYLHGRWPGVFTRHIIKQNTFIDNETGIQISHTNGNIIRNNTLSGGLHSIVAGARENIVEYNTVKNFHWVGISAVGEGGTIRNNTIMNAFYEFGVGINATGEEYTITHNIIDSVPLGFVFSARNVTSTDNVITNAAYAAHVHPSTEDYTDNNIDTTNTVNGHPIYYFEDIEGETFDEEKEIALFVCSRCNNVTIRNYTIKNGYHHFQFRDLTNSTIENITSEGGIHGIQMWDSNNNVIKSSIVRDAAYQNVSLTKSNNNTVIGNTLSGTPSGLGNPRGALRLGHTNNTIITENTFDDNFRHISISSSEENEIFRNNFLGSGHVLIYNVGWAQPNVTYFSRPLPEGGNYWERNGLCVDENSDGICDERYAIRAGRYDDLPWAQPNSWEEAAATPELSFPEDAPEGITTPTGMNNRGIADETEFAFSVVYTHEDGDMPDSVELHIADDTLFSGDTTATSSVYTMTSDGSDPESGVLYTTTLTFPKNYYRFQIRAKVGEQTVLLPAGGSFGSSPSLGGTPFRTGYSNVAFLPGLKASRLYQGNDRRWEPSGGLDTLELQMATSGKSVDPDIYTKTDPNTGLIDEGDIPLTYGLFGEDSNIYKSFISFMDDLQAERVIHKWQALPYDWRLAFDDILRNGAVKDGKLYYDASHGEDTYYIYKNLEALADSSDTGKVTIVAHSMGGLLTKKILADLKDDPTHPYHHLLERVDTVVMVATPQLGTPQAAASLLNGMHEGLPKKFPLLTGRSIARAVAQNMPSAYTLLPSRMYMDRAKEGTFNGSTFFIPTRPVTFADDFIKITEDPLIDPPTFLSHYGSSITDYDKFTSFLRGDEGRGQPKADQLQHPMRLSARWITEAEKIHDQIDGWEAPDLTGNGMPDIRVVQIAGWGRNDTMRGIEYTGKIRIKSCALLSCKWSLDARPKFTTDGDGTVVVPSAIAMDGVETYFVDLYGYNRRLFVERLTVNREHGDILEVNPLRTLIRNIIEYHPNPHSEFQYITDDSDALEADEPYVRLALHSPLNLHIRNSEGNHVGLTATTTPEGEEVFVVNEEIPNSYYLEFGEGKYAGIPLDEETYTITLHAYDSGHFTFEMEEVLGDETIRTQTFSNIPVSTTTIATMTLAQTTEEVTNLSLDTNGDGTPDTLYFSDERQEEITFDTLIEQIDTLTVKKKKALLNRAENAQKQADRGNTKPARNVLESLRSDILTFSEDNAPKPNKIPEDTALHLTAVIDVLIERLEG